MLYVIIDTSVWIDFLDASLGTSAKEKMIALLESRQAAITDVIRHEILAGARTKSEFDNLRRMLGPVKELFVTREEAPLLNEFGFHLKSIGLLGRYSDVSIAFLSRSHDVPVYSFDSYFGRLRKRRIIRTID